MDRLVYGMAKINFQQNCCEDVLTENHTQNISCINPPPPPTVFSFFNTFAQQKFCSSTMSTILPKEEEERTKMSHLPGTNFMSALNSSTETEEELNMAAAEGTESDEIDPADDYPTCSKNNSSAIGRLSQRRNIPSRSCKENLLKTKRRSIAKPKRYASKTSEYTTLRPAEIKKIYLNKRLTNFRPSNLETIFEEEPEKLERRVATGSADDNQLCFIGIRKIKRSLSCSDGFNMNKTIIKQRKAKIKRTFGRRFALKKISFQDFVEHLNKSIADDNNCTQTNETVIEKMDADGNATAILLGNNFKTVSMQSLPLAEEVDIISETGEQAVEDVNILIKSNSFSGVTTTNTAVTDVGGDMGDVGVI